VALELSLSTDTPSTSTTQTQKSQKHSQISKNFNIISKISKALNFFLISILSTIIRKFSKFQKIFQK
jgi:hypothetical protein